MSNTKNWLTLAKHPTQDCYLAVWSHKETGEVFAVAPQIFSDRSRAFDYCIGLAHQGFRDPRTMRKWPKWINAESIGAVVNQKLETFEVLGLEVASLVAVF